MRARAMRHVEDRVLAQVALCRWRRTDQVAFVGLQARESVSQSVSVSRSVGGARGRRTSSTCRAWRSASL